jgi:hypothetical protein
MRIRIVEAPSNPNIYQVYGTLTTNTQVKNQTEILSAIRALPGVTIISTKEINSEIPVTDNSRYECSISIKIDVSLFKYKEEGVKGGIKQIVNNIRKIPGVVSLKIQPKAYYTTAY